MQCSTLKMSVVLVLALALLSIGITGSLKMVEVFQDEDIHNEQFLHAFAFIMTAVTFWIPIQPTLKKVVRCLKSNIKAVKKSLIAMGRILASKKGVQQQV